jgi:diguanylate cyclase (GGDEF)-like protein/PAS domain S-box-containing protein
MTTPGSLAAPLAGVPQGAYQAALDAHAIVAITDLRGVITYVNELFCRISQYSPAELVGQTHRMLNSGTHPPEFFAEMWRTIAAGSVWRGELCNRAKDGSKYWLNSTIVPLHNANGRISHYIAARTDITSRKQLEAHLRSMATTDALTGLVNRNELRSRVQEALSRAIRLPDYGFAVLFMDIDHFKRINDTHGHPAGDALLLEVAQRIRRTLRAVDMTAARIGGDEFVVLLDGVRTTAEAQAAAQRLLAGLAEPFVVGTLKLVVNASMGLAVYHDPASDVDSLLRDADTAMYEAKRGGGGQCVVFEPAFRERLCADAQTESDLRQALQRDEFSVHYQPIVDAHSHRLLGVEALLRWAHPQRGMVAPAEVIPVAESTGLIGSVGDLVLARALGDLAQLRLRLGAQAPAYVAVNLSRAQLTNNELAARMAGLLDAHHLPPACLRVEVTETLAMVDPRALAALHELKALGIGIALDDFGTGYSSLACLHEMPLDVVKIDRSFVARLEEDPRARALVSACVTIAVAQGFELVAEGVESAAQAGLLARLGCGMLQGHHFAEAMPLAALEAWAEGRPQGASAEA